MCVAQLSVQLTHKYLHKSWISRFILKITLTINLITDLVLSHAVYHISDQYICICPHGIIHHSLTMNIPSIGLSDHINFILVIVISLH